MRTIGHIKGRNQKEHGFTLAEILLTLGVISVLLTSLTIVLQQLSREEVDIATASHLDQIGQAVYEMLDDLDQFDALYTAVTAGSGFIEMDVAEIVDPDDDNLVNLITGLAPTDALPEKFRFRSPIRQTYTLIFYANTGGPSNDVLGLSYLILANDRTDQNIARKITQNTGSQAGYYNGDINQDGTTDAIIGSAYGVWRVPLSQLNGTSWHTAVTGSGGAPNNSDGWYLAYYGYINQNQAAKDYVYREPRVGLPQLHTIYGDLNMAGQNIIGADNIYVQNDLLVNDNIVVRGSALLQSQDDIIISGSLVHDGRAQVNEINGPENVIVERNTYVSDFFAASSQTNISNLVSVQDVFVNGTAGSTALEIQGELDLNGADLVAENISTSQVLSSDGTNPLTLTVEETLTALSSFNVTNFTVTGGDLAVFDFVVQGDTTLDLTTQPARVTRLRGASSSGTAVVNITNLVDCQSGCEVSAP